MAVATSAASERVDDLPLAIAGVLGSLRLDVANDFAPELCGVDERETFAGTSARLEALIGRERAERTGAAT